MTILGDAAAGVESCVTRYLMATSGSREARSGEFYGDIEHQNITFLLSSAKFTEATR